MEELGCQTICIKDMAGILGPKEAYDMVKALKENVKLPLFFIHTVPQDSVCLLFRKPLKQDVM